MYTSHIHTLTHTFTDTHHTHTTHMHTVCWRIGLIFLFNHKKNKKERRREENAKQNLLCCQGIIPTILQEKLLKISPQQICLAFFISQPKQHIQPVAVEMTEKPAAVYAVSGGSLQTVLPCHHFYCILKWKAELLPINVTRVNARQVYSCYFSEWIFQMLNCSFWHDKCWWLEPLEREGFVVLNHFKSGLEPESKETAQSLGMEAPPPSHDLQSLWTIPTQGPQEQREDMPTASRAPEL